MARAADVPFEDIVRFLEKCTTSPTVKRKQYLADFRQKRVPREADDVYDIYRLLLPDVSRQGFSCHPAFPGLHACPPQQRMARAALRTIAMLRRRGAGLHRAEASGACCACCAQHRCPCAAAPQPCTLLSARGGKQPCRAHTHVLCCFALLQSDEVRKYGLKEDKLARMLVKALNLQEGDTNREMTLNWCACA